MEILNVSEQQAEPISGESGSVDPAVLSSKDAAAESVHSGPSPDVTGSLEPTIRIEAPDLAPDQDAIAAA